MSRDLESYTVGDFINNFAFWDQDTNDRQYFDSMHNNCNLSDISTDQFKINKPIAEFNKNENNQINLILKQKKLFKVKKFIRYEEILKEICPNEEFQDNELGNKSLNKHKKRKHIIFSKNLSFNKLSSKEKDEKLKNLSKLVKLYRRKIQSMENRLKQNIPKIFKKYLYKKLGINIKNKYLNPKLNFDLKNFIHSQRLLLSFDFEYSDQSLSIINLIKGIAEKRIDFESIQFKKICSQVRLFLPNDKIKYLSKTQKKSFLIFKEKESFISKIEYDLSAKYLNDERIMRTILGISENGSKKKDLKIIIEDFDQEYKNGDEIIDKKQSNEVLEKNKICNSNNSVTNSNFLIN